MSEDFWAFTILMIVGVLCFGDPDLLDAIIGFVSRL
jgi:hypothetical protein